MIHFFKKFDLRIVILSITLLLSASLSLYAEVRVFDNHCAINQQGDKWFFAEENGLYGVYLNDKCVIPIKYQSIRFESPYFFVKEKVGEYSYIEGAYTGDGKVVIPIEDGDLTVRGDIPGLITRHVWEKKEAILYMILT